MNYQVCLLLILLAACTDTPPDPPEREPCVAADVRAGKIVAVSGKVVDFVTGAPVANTIVDVTVGWDSGNGFPPDECPLLATLVTGADGRFGPVTVHAGSPLNPSIMLFLVHGGDRAPTSSDNRTCFDAVCTLDHTIAAPSNSLASAWRSELASGGMRNASTRGLVAFQFKNADGSPAADVQPTYDEGRFAFVPGTEARFLDHDRSTLLSATQRATVGSGVALLSRDKISAILVGGLRGAQRWATTGCLTTPGWIFLEDKFGPP
jgi:hypothetical protein